MRKFLIFYPALGLGGVETYLLRKVRWLADNGFSIFLILQWRAKLDSSLDPMVRVHYMKPGFFPVSEAFNIGVKLTADDTVFCPDPPSLMFAYRYAAALAGCRLLLGVYHPRILRINETDPLPQKFARYAVYKTVLENSFVFMNESCLIYFEKEFNKPFPLDSIVPVGIFDQGRRSTKGIKNKIVSVGRLTDFKKYNISMVNVVKELVDDGFDVSWHVYGDGALRSEMEVLISRFGLQKYIFLHGEIDYSRFVAVVDEARIFVGMGTALVEAGLRGVPTVVALDNEYRKTYGFMYNLDGYDVGEKGIKIPEFDIGDSIRKLLVMSDGDYQAEENKTREHCLRFSMDNSCKLFIKRSTDAPVIDGSLMPRILSMGYYFGVFAVDLRNKTRVKVNKFLKKHLPSVLINILKRK